MKFAVHWAPAVYVLTPGWTVAVAAGAQAEAEGARAQGGDRARPRLQRRLGRRQAAADPERNRVRLRVRARAAHDQRPPGHARRRAGRDPIRAPEALRDDGGEAAPLRGPQGGVL